jgi:hypothetical protein
MDSDDKANRVASDPVLSFKYMANDLDVSVSTFNRVHRPKLPVLAIGERRRGVVDSAYRAYKNSLLARTSHEK